MYRCVIAQNARDKLDALKNAVTDAGALVVGECANGRDALKLTRENSPDALIVSCILPRLDATEISLRLTRMGLSKRPALVVTLLNCMDAKLVRADAYIREPFGAGDIKAALDAALPLPADERVIRRAHELLARMGVAQCEGRAFLSHAIALAVNDAVYARRLTHGAYLIVARAYQTTPKRVGDAVRRAIEKAWTMGDIERQYAFFGNTIDDERGKPTSSGLIALCADILRMEGADLL